MSRPESNVVLTVKLTVRAARALADASEASGLSRTDVVNRALLIYDEIVRLQETGVQIVLRDNEGDVSLRFL